MTEHDTRPVLLAVGDEQDFDAALHFAAREATTRGCALKLVHAYHVIPSGPETALLEFATAEEIAGRTLRLATEHARDVLDGQVEVTGELVREPAVQAIVDASADAQLVVLHRRDLSHLTRLVTRSTSGGVAAHAHAPVAVVPAHWTEDDHTRARTGVVVGLDVSERSATILRQAVAEARARRVLLRVVHACWAPGYFDGPGVGRVAHPNWAAEAAAQMQEVVDGLGDEIADVPVSVETSYARPADALVAASHSAELVVVGRHDPIIPTGSHLGPVARTVLRAAECPVLLVAPSPSHRGWRGARRRVRDETASGSTS